MTCIGYDAEFIHTLVRNSYRWTPLPGSKKRTVADRDGTRKGAHSRPKLSKRKATLVGSESSDSEDAGASDAEDNDGKGAIHKQGPQCMQARSARTKRQRTDSDLLA